MSDASCRMLWIGGILVCTMFFLVISVSFDWEVLAVSGRYSCGHSLLTIANFPSVKRSCGWAMFIGCFTGVLYRLHCHVLWVIYRACVFLCYSPVFMLPFAWFSRSRLSICRYTGWGFRVARAICQLFGFRSFLVPFDGLAFCYASFILGMFSLISPVFMFTFAYFPSIGGSQSHLTVVGAFFSVIL